MSPIAPDGAFARLYRNCVFRSEERVDAHDQVAREFCDHLLAWKRGRVDVAMYKGQIDQLHLFALQYGAEVEVTPGVFNDFSLVHTSLNGGMEVECDGHRLDVAPGRSVVMSPRARIRMRWHAGTVQLILRVPHALLRQVGGLNDDEASPLPPAALIPRAAAGPWALQIQMLLQAHSLPAESALRRQWVRHLEHGVVLFLLGQQPQGQPPADPVFAPRDAGCIESPGLQQAGARRTTALLDYIERRMGAPIGLEDLARAAGCSLRSLNALTHRSHGVAPMELLRNLRLEAVHAHLKLHADARVADKALEYGFGHLGRFAAYYRARFGERPSDTVARTREGGPDHPPRLS